MAFPQSGPIRLQTAGVTFAVASGGSLSAGSGFFWIQAANRVGANQLSNGATTPTDDGVSMSWASGQKIVVTFGTGAWLAGEDVWEFVVSGSATDDPTTAKILAKIRTRDTAVIGAVSYPGKGVPLAFPLTIELTNDDHVAIGEIVATAAALPASPIHGMVRYVQSEAAFWQFDDAADAGLLAAAGGYWIEHYTGFSQYLADSAQPAITDTQVQGYARPINQIATGTQSDVVIDVAPYLGDGTLQSPSISPLFCIANPLGSSPLDANSNIGFRFFVNGVNQSVGFIGKTIATLLGKVNLSDGSLDTSADGVGAPQSVGPTITGGAGGIITPEQLDGGYGWLYRLQLQFIADGELLAQGDRLTYYATVDGTLGLPAPYAALLGQGVADVGDRMVVLPSTGTAKATIGSGSLLSLDESTNQGVFTPFSGQRDILGILANTDGQVIAVNAPFNSVVVRANDGALQSYDEKRAQIGTGLGPASGRYSATGWSSPVAISGGGQTLQVVVTHPTTIRADYPDSQIAGKTAPYNAAQIVVFVRFGGTIYEAIATSTLASPQTILITDLGSTILGALPDSSSDPAFGLSGNGTVAASAITAGSTLAAGSYEVAIASEYNGSQITRISHSTSDGCIRLISQSGQLAYLNQSQVFTKAQQSHVVDLTITSGVVTIDCSLSNKYRLELTEDVTSVAISNLSAGTNFDIEIKQDSTGGRTVAGWASAFSWIGGVPPTVTAAAGGVTVISFSSFDGAAVRSVFVQNFS